MTRKKWLHIFATNLIWVMNMNNVSQKELSIKTGISENAISNYVHENKEPKITNVIKMAKALNCDIRDLIY